MRSDPIRCLILACGNPLRSDDGVGAWLAAWAQTQFQDVPAARVIYRQQWTPELADEVARSQTVIFIDASIDAIPGVIELRRVGPAPDSALPATHHLNASQLLAVCKELYETLPLNSLLLTIGIGSVRLGETFSAPVHDSLPEACRLLEKSVLQPDDPAIL
jgi:hydrogenase maturation protease